MKYLDLKIGASSRCFAMGFTLLVIVVVVVAGKLIATEPGDVLSSSIAAGQHELPNQPLPEKPDPKLADEPDQESESVKNSEPEKEVPWWESPLVVLTPLIILFIGAMFKSFMKSIAKSEGDNVSAFFHKWYGRLKLNRKYRNLLRSKLGKIRIRGVLPFVEVDLDDETFVPLHFIPGELEDDEHQRNDRRGQMDDRKPIKPDEVMKRFIGHNRRLLLVIGEAGSGKSTLMQYYALSCLDRGRTRSLGFRKGVKLFFLPFRDLNFDENDIEADLPKKLSEWTKREGLLISQDLFEHWLDRNSLILLDGLDEIFNIEKRKAACRWIEKVAERFDKSKFVLTSRPRVYGRNGVTLNLQIERADINKLDEDQQNIFLHNWLKAAYQQDRSEAGLFARKKVAS